jgi:hypothetical protein
MDHPKDVGDYSTLEIMRALRWHGYRILVPFGENTRYDLVIDDGVKLSRVQCKTGRHRSGVLEFSTASTYGHHRNPKIHRRSYIGEIDYFAVCCRDTGAVHLIAIDEVQTRAAARLRIEPPLNNQRRRIRYAAEYEVTVPAALVTPEPGARADGSGSSA